MIIEEFNWIAEGAIPISREEAEEDIFRKVPTPTFKLVQGPEKSVDDLPMLLKQNINAEAEPGVPSMILKMHPIRNKKKLPMFSFCVDGKVHAIVLDIESGVPLFKVLKALDGYSYYAYNSVNSELERPRFRVVIPLAEPIDGEVLDYCKPRLHEAFGKVADTHSYEHTRFFFMPSVLTGPFNEENVMKTAEGASIDFIKTTNFTEEDELKMKADMLKHHEAKERTVIDDERVQYYLSTDFPLMRGNGDSASSFYRAICVCLAHGDEETLDKVCDKARSENWSEKEINYNIKRAKSSFKK